MVLEATILILDNSEWMRNGDYLPTRMEAQQDAVNLICAAKTQQNPESSVAVMSMAGKSPEVLVTLTQDLGRILNACASVTINGQSNFTASLQVAQLALKHRQNKLQHQRIVVFIGSPIKETGDELVVLAKNLKKNNVAVDVVNFGEEATNAAKLDTFIATVSNPDEESHLVTIPPGPHILSDILLSSAIVMGEGGGFGAAAAAQAAVAAHAGAAMGGFGDLGVDPSEDPELAMALQASLQDAAAQRQREATQTSQPASTPAPSQGGDIDMEDDDEELQRALALSQLKPETPAATQAPAPAPTATTTTTTTTATSRGDVQMSDDDDELQAALRMSAPPGGQAQQPPAAGGAPQDQALDPSFLNSVLSTLHGVDPNDARIQGFLQSLQGGQNQGGGEKKDDDKDKKK